CPLDAPRMDGHAQTLAMRALLEAFALHEPPNTDPLWEVEVPDLGSHGRFEQHDAHRIPRQPAADVCDHGEVSHVAGDEHRTVEVLPVGLIVMLKCRGHNSTISKGDLTSQGSGPAPARPQDRILEA